LADDEFTEESLPMQTFIADLDTFLQSFKSCLAPSTFESFIGMVTRDFTPNGKGSSQSQVPSGKFKF
jgi:hypothetical protein